MAPPTVSNEVRQAILSTGGLAVHLETCLGLGGGGSSGTLLEAGAFSTRGESGNISLGDWGESKDQ